MPLLTKHNKLHDLLCNRFPVEMSEFSSAPFDYRIYGPTSFDDTATLTIVLFIGKSRHELRRVALELEVK